MVSFHVPPTSRRRWLFFQPTKRIGKLDDPSANRLLEAAGGCAGFTPPRPASAIRPLSSAVESYLKSPLERLVAGANTTSSLRPAIAVV